MGMQGCLLLPCVCPCMIWNYGADHLAVLGCLMVAPKSRKILMEDRCTCYSRSQTQSAHILSPWAPKEKLGISDRCRSKRHVIIFIMRAAQMVNRTARCTENVHRYVFFL